MSRKLPHALFALLFSVFLAGSASAANYYIANNGNDANPGTQSAPWAHLPGMATWSGGHTPIAGDTFILRGCDVWGNANLPVRWQWSGTSSAHIVVTVDQSWFNTTNCSSWNRPKFDAQSAVIDPPECQGNNTFVEFNSNSFIDFYWIELINYFWTSSQAGGSCFVNEAPVTASNTAGNITWNNGYVHRWTLASGADDIDHGFMGCSQTCKVDTTVFDNSDGAIHTGIGVQWPTTRSIFKNVANALKPNNSGEFGYNDISHVGAVVSGVHPNCIESIPTLRGDGKLYIHDNRVHDNQTCEGLQVGNPGETDYVWNNLWYNNTSNGANGPNLPQNGNNTVAIYYWNNTNVDQRGVCVSVGSNGNKWSSAFIMQNNHCITSGTPSGSTQSGGMVDGTISGASTIKFSNNIVESLSSANANGYSNAQNYVYSPASSTSATVGAGVNLTSAYWPAGFPMQDTTYACMEQTVNGVVKSVCPARPSNTRPSSGAWDVGAYSLGSGSVSAPSSPTGLTAVVQ